MALRTAMRGALIVKRRRSSRKRIFSLSPQQLDHTWVWAKKSRNPSELGAALFRRLQKA
jgi:hypothetical protein